MIDIVNKVKNFFGVVNKSKLKSSVNNEKKNWGNIIVNGKIINNGGLSATPPKYQNGSSGISGTSGISGLSGISGVSGISTSDLINSYYNINKKITNEDILLHFGCRDTKNNSAIWDTYVMVENYNLYTLYKVEHSSKLKSETRPFMVFDKLSSYDDIMYKLAKHFNVTKDEFIKNVTLYNKKIN
jgi:hypothetical protein